MGLETRSFTEVIRRDSNKIKTGEHAPVLRGSIYSERVKRYLEKFGRKQVKILIFEEFFNDVNGTIEEVLKFLEIENGMHDFTEKKYNEFRAARGKLSKAILRSRKIKKIARSFLPETQLLKLTDKLLYDKNVEKPKISEKDREFLVQFFSDDVNTLQKILGRKLNWF